MRFLRKQPASAVLMGAALAVDVYLMAVNLL